jgi:branched-chain amino acid transport system permease protein
MTGLVAQIFLNTLQIGAVYVLFALGLTLVFGVMKVINFAHGQFFTGAALVIAATMPMFTARFGMPAWVDYFVCFVLAMVAVGVLAAVLYFVGFERYLRDLVGSFILSVGLLLLLDGVYLWAFSGAPRVVPKLLTGQVSLGGGAMETQRLVICCLALAATVGLYQLVQHTKLGWALRAVAEDREAAMLQGIRYRRISFYGFMIGSALAAISGGLIAPLTAITPALGNDYLTKAFIIIIIGGLGSIPGAIVGGFLIAAIESVAGSLYDLSYATIAMFGLVILFLLIRPQGILGHAQR